MKGLCALTEVRPTFVGGEDYQVQGPIYIQAEQITVLMQIAKNVVEVWFQHPESCIHVQGSLEQVKGQVNAALCS